MSAPDEPPLPRGQPNVDLLLAQALDACIEAERRRQGSSAAIIARAPEAARADLRRLMQTVRFLERERSRATPSATFRVAARARLMRRIGGASQVSYAEPRTIGGARPFTSSTTGSQARTRWLLRSVAGLVAAAAATAAGVGVSASALPGDALYGFKQAREELSLRLAADDEQRLQALLQRGDARLDETARLIELGRTTEAAETVERFDAVAERATTEIVETSDVGQVAPVLEDVLGAKLDEQHERLRRILEIAPQPARDDLRDVLRASAIDRDVAIERRPAERPAQRSRTSPPSAEPPPPVSTGPTDEQSSIAPITEAAEASRRSESDRNEPPVGQAGGPGPGRPSAEQRAAAEQPPRTGGGAANRSSSSASADAARRLQEPGRSSGDSVQRTTEAARNSTDWVQRDNDLTRSGSDSTRREGEAARRRGGQPARAPQATDAPRR